MNWALLLKQKTFWTGLGSIVAGAGGMITGEMTSVDAIQLTILGLLAIFGRDALNKK